MINTLHIKNIGIIDEIYIDLNNGLNVLTGETGAGKTLIIDSLNIISGGRFSKEMIRNGEEYSFVELSMEEDIIVSRETNINGKNLCKINGRLATVNELKEFMSTKIDIHGQHDNQTLLDIKTHIELLDNFANNKIKAKYQEKFEKYKELVLEIKQNNGDPIERSRKLDLLKYQFNEIEEAKLKIGEDEELESRRKIIQNFEKIGDSLKNASYQVGENGIDAISIATKELEKIESLDEKYSNMLISLKNSYYDLQELSRDMVALQENTEFDYDELKKVEDRLDLIFSLKRKYGTTIEQILEYKEQISKEVFEIENGAEYLEKLNNKLEQIKIEMFELCKKLDEIRRNAKIELEEKINVELQDLEMQNAKFKVDIVYLDNMEFNINGLNKVEFLISTNIGEGEKPLAKIASGGEMSRIMLAIKTVLANVDEVGVLVFDEIDTGISGKAAASVAEKLKIISKKHQVLCVTHLAPIAAKGDYNYYIDKSVNNGKTKTKIKILDKEDKIKEVARIASGSVTDIAIEHAKSLM